MAHYPKLISETVNQAYGAAGRAITLLSHETVIASGSVCEVEENKCMGCGACAEVCSYGAIEFRKTPRGDKAVVNPVICKGDGLCNVKCPTGAIMLKHFMKSFSAKLTRQFKAYRSLIMNPAGITN